MQEEDTKIRVLITRGTLLLAEFHSAIQGGRSEFVFAQPIYAHGRRFEGFALEQYLDREMRHVTYQRDLIIPFVR